MARVLAAGAYLGSVLHRSTYGGALLSDLAHFQGRALPVHEHRAAYFSLLLRGDYRECIGSTQMDYRPFCVGFHPAGLRHHDQIGVGGARFFNIDVSDEWVDRWPGQFETILQGPPRFLGGASALRAARLFAMQHAGTLSLEVVDEAVSELLAEAGRISVVAERRRPRWLARCLEMLYGAVEHPITLVALARTLDLHPVYLSRAFRRWQGCSVGTFAQRLRIQAACRLLATSDQTLGEVAATTGFADQSHFARVFRSVLGIPPGRFRGLLGSGQRTPSVTLARIYLPRSRPRSEGR